MKIINIDASKGTTTVTIEMTGSIADNWSRIEGLLNNSPKSGNVVSTRKPAAKKAVNNDRVVTQTTIVNEPVSMAPKPAIKPKDNVVSTTSTARVSPVIPAKPTTQVAPRTRPTDSKTVPQNANLGRTTKRARPVIS